MGKHLDINRQFVPYELALKLKELGFDEPCFGVYINGRFYPRYKSTNSRFNPNQKLDKTNVQYCTAPTWQQVFDWLFKEFSYICTFTNNMTYEQKENMLNEAIRGIQNNISK